MLVSAPSISGAGSGKGLLVRAICEIAFGQPPQAFTGCRDIAELEKRISAALIEAAPVLFIDNVNDTALRSDLLASVLTEPSVRARRLGESQMLPLNPTAFVAVTGNGVTLSEDLVRRFITVELDPRMDDPENRPFAPGFVASVSARRPELLAAALTIWLLGPPKRLRARPRPPARQLRDLGALGPRSTLGAGLRRSRRAHCGDQGARSTAPARRRDICCLVGASRGQPGAGGVCKANRPVGGRGISILIFWMAL